MEVEDMMEAERKDFEALGPGMRAELRKPGVRSEERDDNKQLLLPRGQRGVRVPRQ